MKMRLPQRHAAVAIGRAGSRPAAFTRRIGLRPAEAAFLLAALLFVGIVVAFYFIRVQPLNQQVESLQMRERELRARIEKRDADEKKRLDQIANSRSILESLTRFEASLKPDMRGMTQIIEEIDALGRTNKVLVGDANYRVEEAVPLTDEKGVALPESSSSEKAITVYPVMAIETSVIGDYPNLRRFLAELERSRQFLIIRSLAFQGEADKVRSESAKVGGVARLQMSTPDAIPVSLKIDLDTYFQKPRAEKR